MTLKNTVPQIRLNLNKRSTSPIKTGVIGDNSGVKMVTEKTTHKEKMPSYRTKLDINMNLQERRGLTSDQHSLETLGTRPGNQT